jgi:hypothetical protein
MNKLAFILALAAAVPTDCGGNPIGPGCDDVITNPHPSCPPGTYHLKRTELEPGGCDYEYWPASCRTLLGDDLCGSCACCLVEI